MNCYTITERIMLKQFACFSTKRYKKKKKAEKVMLVHVEPFACFSM